jgi:hypothetical protein
LFHGCDGETANSKQWDMLLPLQKVATMIFDGTALAVLF